MHVMKMNGRSKSVVLMKHTSGMNECPRRSAKTTLPQFGVLASKFDFYEINVL